ncbi:MAG TPA: hypothetical protein VGI39_43335 [Polyangiaceae bacterium]
MIAGHFGFAAAVKAKAPAAPLWALMLASQWLDVVFVPLLIAKVETLEPVAGSKPGEYAGAVIHADYTHSLVGALVLSALLGALFWRRHGRNVAAVLGLTAFSHWLLDLPFHRADMPILPGGGGGLPMLGFGLWNHPALTAGIELLFVLVGAAAYWRAARGVSGQDAVAQRRATICGSAVLAAGVATLALNVLGM